MMKKHTFSWDLGTDRLLTRNVCKRLKNVPKLAYMDVIIKWNDIRLFSEISEYVRPLSTEFGEDHMIIFKKIDLPLLHLFETTLNWLVLCQHVFRFEEILMSFDIISLPWIHKLNTNYKSIIQNIIFCVKDADFCEAFENQNCVKIYKKVIKMVKHNPELTYPKIRVHCPLISYNNMILRETLYTSLISYMQKIKEEQPNDINDKLDIEFV